MPIENVKNFRWTEVTAIRMIKQTDPINNGVIGKTITVDQKTATLGVWSAVDFLTKKCNFRVV